jgi:hypothetical protein
MKTLHTLSAAALLALATSAASAAAPLIDVQFSNDVSHTQTGAAVTGQAGDGWNNFTTGHAGGGSLLDTTGGATGVSLSFTADTFWESATTYTRFTGTPVANLMQGYLVGYTGSTGIDLAFSGLAAGHEYGFWVYTQGDDNSPNRSISIVANGGTPAVSTQSNGSSFSLGDNYLYFTTVADANGSIDITGKSLVGEANINGIQLTAVPEPSEMALLTAGLAFLAGAALRKSRRA